MNGSIGAVGWVVGWGRFHAALQSAVGRGLGKPFLGGCCDVCWLVFFVSSGKEGCGTRVDRLLSELLGCVVFVEHSSKPSRILGFSSLHLYLFLTTESKSSLFPMLTYFVFFLTPCHVPLSEVPSPTVSCSRETCKHQSISQDAPSKLNVTTRGSI